MKLSARGLRYRVDGRDVVDGIDVQAGAGALYAVSGPSGAGKSTLLALLGGLLRPAEGTVLLNDRPVLADDRNLRRRFAYVLQGYGLVSALTGRENIAVALQARGVARSLVRERAGAALDQVGLSDVADHLIDDMSGGQQQRVAVARALACAPDVLLADEPTAELDAENRARIVELLKAHARLGAVVVVASHDPDVVAECSGGLELDGGRIVARD